MKGRMGEWENGRKGDITLSPFLPLSSSPLQLFTPFLS